MDRGGLSMTKEEILKEDMKRLLILWQLWKVALTSIQTSDTLALWAAKAKENKNKGYVDLRVLAAEQLRYIQSFLIRMKRTLTPETFNAVMTELSGPQIDEINLLIEEATYLEEEQVADIWKKVQEVRKAIPNT